MSTAVERLIDGIIEREGREYTDHPDDSGGPTRFGITQVVARAAGYAGDMRDFPEGLARAIYAEQYYIGPRFDRVAELSPAIAHELADTGVNLGPPRAVMFLQRALNTFNQQGTKYPDALVDGFIGMKTLANLKAFLDWRGQDGVGVMLTALDCQQGCYYIERTEARPANEEFVYGWLKNRIGGLGG